MDGCLLCVGHNSCMSMAPAKWSKPIEKGRWEVSQQTGWFLETSKWAGAICFVTNAQAGRHWHEFGWAFVRISQ